jgi:mitogen-activated protein kinase kinase kinase
MGALADGLDSDDEDSSILAASGESDRASILMLDSEPIRPETVEDRERLEWQTMLASVLSGDVLRTEKSRIATALETSNDELSHMYEDIWIGLRAKLRSRTVEEERKSLEERRLRVVDRVLDEVLHFRVDTTEATRILMRPHYFR